MGVAKEALRQQDWRAVRKKTSISFVFQVQICQTRFERMDFLVCEHMCKALKTYPAPLIWNIWIIWEICE